MEPEVEWRQRWYRLCLVRMLIEFPSVERPIVENAVKVASTVVANRWADWHPPYTFDARRQEFFDECRRALREAAQ